jgi:hypothetical protein
MVRDLPVTVEPFQFSPAKPVAYDWSYVLGNGSSIKIKFDLGRYVGNFKQLIFVILG